MKNKIFLLKDIVKINYGNKLDLQKMTQDNPQINFISRSGLNNGLAAIVDKLNNIKPYEAGCLTVALGGSIGATFYQNKPFYTAQNIAVIQFDNNISIYAKLYLAQVIKYEVKNKFRAFGRELNKHIKVDFTVTLPVDNDNNPDWIYMENYVKSLRYKPIETNIIYLEKDLCVDLWQEYKISDLFDVNAGKYHYTDEYSIGLTPYVSASNTNNGIAQKIDISPDFVGNCIVTGKVGCTAFYQHEDFCATSDVNILIPKNFVLNKYIGLFLVTIINKSENYKWSYGRQCRVGDSKEIIIKLPTKNNQPDWDYMENYIKNLPYGDRI